MATFPASEGSLSTPCISAWRTCATFKPGSRARTSAATPATCGVAIEVPLRLRQPPGTVLQIVTPGAARSTKRVPKFENVASWSARSLAATQTMLARP